MVVELGRPGLSRRSLCPSLTPRAAVQAEDAQSPPPTPTLHGQGAAGGHPKPELDQLVNAGWSGFISKEPLAPRTSDGNSSALFKPGLAPNPI